MAVKMRLRREGKKKQPHYRIVVSDVRSPRDGRFVEDLGYYQPLAEPSAIKLDHDRALQWLQHGAQPTEAVKNLLQIEGVWESFRPGEAGAKAERRERRARRRAEKTPETTEAAEPAEATGGEAAASSAGEPSEAAEASDERAEASEGAEESQA